MLRGDFGQSFVELALVLPLLLTIVFGITEFGVVITDQETLNHAAEDGARYGARGDNATNLAAAQSETSSYLSDLLHCPSPSVSVTYDEGIPDFVTVTVSCTYSPITPLGTVVSLLGSTVNTTPTLSATSIMRVQ